jgi:hypothetical protein
LAAYSCGVQRKSRYQLSQQAQKVRLSDCQRAQQTCREIVEISHDLIDRYVKTELLIAGIDKWLFEQRGRFRLRQVMFVITLGGPNCGIPCCFHLPPRTRAGMYPDLHVATSATKDGKAAQNSAVPQKNSGKTAFLTIAADLIHY